MKVEAGNCQRKGKGEAMREIRITFDPTPDGLSILVISPLEQLEQMERRRRMLDRFAGLGSLLIARLENEERERVERMRKALEFIEEAKAAHGHQLPARR